MRKHIFVKYKYMQEREKASKGVNLRFSYAGVGGNRQG